MKSHAARDSCEIESRTLGNSKIVSISDLKMLDLNDADDHGRFIVHNKSWEQHIGDILISYF